MMKKLYPFRSNLFDLDGLRYHYLDEGSGDSIVMVHGNPTWSFYYRTLVREFRTDHRVIAPDHIGCGLSDKPPAERYPYRLERRVDDLERLLEHLGVTERITLVLHDWGGMIGMAYALRDPERIERLVLLNTAAFHLPASKGFPWTLWLARTGPVGEYLVRGLNAFSLGATYFCCTKRPMKNRVRQAYLQPYGSWEERVAVHRFVTDIPLKPDDPSYDLVSDVEENLWRFRNTPTLILWGERDFVFDRHFLEIWEREFPHAEVHRFPEAGHYVLEDVPEKIRPRIRAFLARHPLMTKVGDG